jgi:hypothetical protein
MGALFYVWSLLLLAAAVLTLIAGKYFRVYCIVRANSMQTYSHFLQKPPHPPQSPTKQKHTDGNPEDVYYNIEPLRDFDVDTEEPIKARPFKPKFHMTMGA